MNEKEARKKVCPIMQSRGVVEYDADTVTCMVEYCMAWVDTTVFPEGVTTLNEEQCTGYCALMPKGEKT